MTENSGVATQLFVSVELVNCHVRVNNDLCTWFPFAVCMTVGASMHVRMHIYCCLHDCGCQYACPHAHLLLFAWLWVPVCMSACTSTDCGCQYACPHAHLLLFAWLWVPVCMSACTSTDCGCQYACPHAHLLLFAWLWVPVCMSACTSTAVSCHFECGALILWRSLSLFLSPFSDSLGGAKCWSHFSGGKLGLKKDISAFVKSKLKVPRKRQRPAEGFVVGYGLFKDWPLKWMRFWEAILFSQRFSPIPTHPILFFARQFVQYKTATSGDGAWDPDKVDMLLRARVAQVQVVFVNRFVQTLLVGDTPTGTFRLVYCFFFQFILGGGNLCSSFAFQKRFLSIFVCLCVFVCGNFVFISISLSKERLWNVLFVWARCWFSRCHVGVRKWLIVDLWYQWPSDRFLAFSPMTISQIYLFQVFASRFEPSQETIDNARKTASEAAAASVSDCLGGGMCCVFVVPQSKSECWASWIVFEMLRNRAISGKVFNTYLLSAATVFLLLSRARFLLACSSLFLGSSSGEAECEENSSRCASRCPSGACSTEFSLWPCAESRTWLSLCEEQVYCWAVFRWSTAGDHRLHDSWAVVGGASSVWNNFLAHFFVCSVYFCLLCNWRMLLQGLVLAFKEVKLMVQTPGQRTCDWEYLLAWDCSRTNVLLVFNFDARTGRASDSNLSPTPSAL